MKEKASGMPEMFSLFICLKNKTIDDFFAGIIRRRGAGCSHAASHSDKFCHGHSGIGRGRTDRGIERAITTSRMVNAAVPFWLSVVIPSYKGEEWIDAALRSVAAEPCDGVEVVLVDGGPTSAARDIAAQYSDRVHLKILERSDLLSWQSKTDFGMKLASAPHACWLGVDDVWLPGRTKAIRRWLDAAPEATLHLAPTMIIGRRGQRLGIWKCPLPSEVTLAQATVTGRLLVQNFVGAPAPVFRRDAWIACGGLDDQLWYAADWDMWLKLAGLGGVVAHSEVTVGFRVHESSLTSVGSRDVTDFATQMRAVFDRHRIAADINVDDPIERIARASIAVNSALAAAASGNWQPVLGALGQVLRLGPVGWYRYQRDSRILDRVIPRIRVRILKALRLA